MSVLSTNGPGKPQGYPDLLADIKQRIRSAQYAALKAVNQKMVGLYRDIGRMKASFEAHIGLENSRHWCEKLPGHTALPL